MSKFDFLKEAKQEIEVENSKPTSYKSQITKSQSDVLTVQVTLPQKVKRTAMRNQRQMTIHEDVYQAAAKYAKANNMSVSRLFETVMAQALNVNVDD